MSYYNKIKLTSEQGIEIMNNIYDEDVFLNQVDNILDMLNSFNNPFKIFRVIFLDKLKKINFSDLGESWSFDRDSSIEFGNNNLNKKPNIIFEGMIYYDNVDWKESFKRYCFNSLGEFSEDEIVVKNTNKIKNLKIKKL